MRYFYLRNKQGFPVGCVASDKFPRKNGEYIVRFGVSSYNPTDKFDKLQAKLEAQKRINLNGSNFVMYSADFLAAKPVKWCIMSQIATEQVEGVSTDSRDAAKFWLKRYNLDQYLKGTGWQRH